MHCRDVRTEFLNLLGALKFGAWDVQGIEFGQRFPRISSRSGLDEMVSSQLFRLVIIEIIRLGIYIYFSYTL